jgi:hypothetical protein
VIAALLARAAHAATPEGASASSDPTYARLFGEESAASDPAQEPGPAFPWWTLPAGVGALGLVAASRLRAPGESGSTAPAVRVVSRQAVGDKSHLVVVDIPTQAGNRRLLVGTGGGAPSLVADLGPAPELPVADAAFLAGLASVGDRKTSFQDMLEALGGRNLPLERLTRPGIAAGAILGFGRAIGETMIVLMASGNAAVVELFDPTSSARTVSGMRWFFTWRRQNDSIKSNASNAAHSIGLVRNATRVSPRLRPIAENNAARSASPNPVTLAHASSSHLRISASMPDSWAPPSSAIAGVASSVAQPAPGSHASTHACA